MNLECDVSYVKWCHVSEVIELTKEAGDVDKMSHHNLELSKWYANEDLDRDPMDYRDVGEGLVLLT